MTLTPTEAQALLERARALNAARSYPELADALDGLDPEDLVAEPELAFLSADVSRRVGRGERSLELLGLLETVCRKRGNDRLNRNRLNLEGVVRFERGDVDAAERAWIELLEACTMAGDAEFDARANNNLGVICTLHTRIEDALTYYTRAVASYQRLGYRRGLAQSHHNLAITFRELGFPHEADAHFQKAADLARADGSEDELARVEQERSMLLLQLGDPALARVSASRALERYESLDDPAGRGETRRVLGLVALSEGELDLARGELDDALELARGCHATLLEAEVLEALAVLDQRSGRASRAESRRREATALFATIGAESWGLRIRGQAMAIAGLPEAS